MLGTPSTKNGRPNSEIRANTGYRRRIPTRVPIATRCKDQPFRAAVGRTNPWKTGRIDANEINRVGGPLRAHACVPDAVLTLRKRESPDWPGIPSRYAMVSVYRPRVVPLEGAGFEGPGRLGAGFAGPDLLGAGLPGAGLPPPGLPGAAAFNWGFLFMMTPRIGQSLCERRAEVEERVLSRSDREGRRGGCPVSCGPDQRQEHLRYPYACQVGCSRGLDTINPCRSQYGTFPVPARSGATRTEPRNNSTGSPPRHRHDSPAGWCRRRPLDPSGSSCADRCCRHVASIINAI